MAVFVKRSREKHKPFLTVSRDVHNSILNWTAFSKQDPSSNLSNLKRLNYFWYYYWNWRDFIYEFNETIVSLLQIKNYNNNLERIIIYYYLLLFFFLFFIVSENNLNVYIYIILILYWYIFKQTATFSTLLLSKNNNEFFITRKNILNLIACPLTRVD